jgi:glycopeptide antibiotics resistance protein
LKAAPAAHPRKSTARLLWALFSLFVVYGTTFPFQFRIGWGRFLIEAHRINWRPLGGTADNLIISDIVQNILLFIPFGFLGYFSLVYKSSRLRKLGIVLAGATLSAGVEFLQIFSPSRWPAMSDVVFNTAGTALGLVLAVAFKKSVLGFKSQPWARRFLDAPSAFPAFIFLVLVASGCWEPFDFSLDVGMVWDHLKSLMRDPFRFKNPDVDMISFIRFLLANLFLCRLALEAGLKRPVLWGTGFMASLGVGLELSQAIIQSRAPEFQDALVAVLGALSGGIVYFFPGFHRRPRIWTAAGGLMVLVSAAARGLYPYHFTARYSGFNWVLFRTEYKRTTFAALGNFIESAMIFFPLGFLWGYFYPRIRPSALAALLAGGLAMMVEIAQGFVPGRYADITDVLGAILGGMAGGMALTRGWPAFKEYMRRDDDTQI